jgi:transcriptional regulator with XRE-family HTH domain
MPEVRHTNDQMRPSDTNLELVDELKRIRKGRGISTTTPEKLIGHHLARLCGVSEHDTPETIRVKLIGTISKLLTELDVRDSKAVAAAIGLGAEYTERQLLGERIDILAAELGVDARTARRRIDTGLERLAEAALAFRNDAAGSENAAKRGWHSKIVRTVVLLRKTGIEVIELRTIVSEVPTLRSIYLGFSTHAAEKNKESPQKQLEIDALFGGNIFESHVETSARTGLSLRLPRPLRIGETYEYGVRFRLPAGANVRPYYVLVPIVSCNEFDLRVKFEDLPSKVELLSGVFQADTQDSVLEAPAVEIDPLGEVRATFRQLQAGMAYGIRWTE